MQTHARRDANMCAADGASAVCAVANAIDGHMLAVVEHRVVVGLVCAHAVLQLGVIAVDACVDHKCVHGAQWELEGSVEAIERELRVVDAIESPWNLPRVRRVARHTRCARQRVMRALACLSCRHHIGATHRVQRANDTVRLDSHARLRAQELEPCRRQIGRKAAIEHVRVRGGDLERSLWTRVDQAFLVSVARLDVEAYDVALALPGVVATGRARPEVLSLRPDGEDRADHQQAERSGVLHRAEFGLDGLGG
mmetsp:Transcript_8379/g.21637  ORF Transcript_8379/g.21637 Transcript_8379/m.21637 type:complete len:253 (-) Transcript_8379:8-766(-)